jgi:hypothetical protein
VSSGVRVADSQLTQFEKGKTTEADVVKALGPPTSVTTTNGVRTLGYAGVHAQPRASSFIPIVGAFVGGADSQVSIVIFQFNADGKLETMTSTQSSTGTRTGIPAGTEAGAAQQPRKME